MPTAHCRAPHAGYVSAPAAAQHTSKPTSHLSLNLKVCKSCTRMSWRSLMLEALGARNLLRRMGRKASGIADHQSSQFKSCATKCSQRLLHGVLGQLSSR